MDIKNDQSLYEARPILKWVGGKSGLLAQIDPLLPKVFSCYREPFIGGMSIYLHLYNTYSSFQAYLSDLNQELITTYMSVINDWEDIKKLLDLYSQYCSKEWYLKIRKQEVNKLSSVEIAARMIFLNKTCFNGMYRVNSKGEFNVPFGKKPSGVSLYNEKNILYFIKALKGQKLSCAKYQDSLKGAGPSEFIYLDPPYAPISATSSFTAYTKDNFGEVQQIELSKLFRKLDAKGCLLMESNSYSPNIEKLYKGFDLSIIEARRSINCKADGRKPIKEYVIRNY